jgi:hypothetical protein
MLEKILDQIIDMVENVPEDLPYDTFKAHLPETHTLSDQEKMDILFKSEPLGGRKLSQMLANLLAYCPSGMEQSIHVQEHVPSTSACHLRIL